MICLVESEFIFLSYKDVFPPEIWTDPDYQENFRRGGNCSVTPLISQYNH